MIEAQRASINVVEAELTRRAQEADKQPGAEFRQAEPTTTTTSTEVPATEMGKIDTPTE